MWSLVRTPNPVKEIQNVVGRFIAPDLVYRDLQLSYIEVADSWELMFITWLLLVFWGWITKYGNGSIIFYVL
jgi:hypothetical protein